MSNNVDEPKKGSTEVDENSTDLKDGGTNTLTEGTDNDSGNMCHYTGDSPNHVSGESGLLVESDPSPSLDIEGALLYLREQADGLIKVMGDTLVLSRLSPEAASNVTQARQSLMLGRAWSGKLMALYREHPYPSSTDLSTDKVEKSVDLASSELVQGLRNDLLGQTAAVMVKSLYVDLRHLKDTAREITLALEDSLMPTSDIQPTADICRAMGERLTEATFWAGYALGTFAER